MHIRSCLGLLLLFVSSVLLCTFLSCEFLWIYVYVSTLALSIAYFIVYLKRLYTLLSLLIIFQFINITFSAIPYIFYFQPPKEYYASLFLNSLGLLFTLGMAFLLASSRQKNIKLEHSLFQTTSWKKFVMVNKTIFYFTIPFIFIVMIVSGGWHTFLGENASFDRVASMKSMGGLMIFSVINVFSGIILVVQAFNTKLYIKALVPLFFILVVNGFTLGRGNLIWLFLVLLFVSGMLGRVNYRLLLVFSFLGFSIVLAKYFRTMSYGSHSYSDLVMFFLQFSGDFDSVVNTSKLLSYISSHGFIGPSPIYSQILTYLPRFLFTDKPEIFGVLSINHLVFPGVYTGKIGSTGYSFGSAGTLYSAFGGLGVIILYGAGLFILGSLDKYIRIFSIKDCRVTVLFVAYLFFLGNMIILSRDYYTAFYNVLFYVTVYLVLYRMFYRGRMPFK